MDAKKSYKADLNRFRPLLFEAGLVVALALVVLTFAYAPGEYRIRQLSVVPYTMDAELPFTIVIIPNEEEDARQVDFPTVVQKLQFIPADRLVQTPISEFDFQEFDDYAEILALKEIVPEEYEYTEGDPVGDYLPRFQNGDFNSFVEWVQKNLKYPMAATERGIKGRVFLSFVIDKKGDLTQIVVLNSSDPLLAEASVKVLKKSPRWTPGRTRGYKTVDVRFTLPLNFELEEQ